MNQMACAGPDVAGKTGAGNNGVEAGRRLPSRHQGQICDDGLHLPAWSPWLLRTDGTPSRAETRNHFRSPARKGIRGCGWAVERALAALRVGRRGNCGGGRQDGALWRRRAHVSWGRLVDRASDELTDRVWFCKKRIRLTNGVSLFRRAFSCSSASLGVCNADLAGRLRGHMVARVFAMPMLQQMGHARPFTSSLSSLWKAIRAGGTAERVIWDTGREKGSMAFMALASPFPFAFFAVSEGERLASVVNCRSLCLVVAHRHIRRRPFSAAGRFSTSAYHAYFS